MSRNELEQLKTPEELYNMVLQASVGIMTGRNLLHEAGKEACGGVQLAIER